MQCPKCRYEPTFSELKQSPDDCVQCGASFSTPTVIRNRSSRRSRIWVSVAALAAIVFVAAGSMWGISTYKKNDLVSLVEVKMRTANGLVSEILDEKARLTNAGFLEKIPRRIAAMDDLLASTLAINDARIPGLTSATADYVRASRTFLNVFTDDLRQGIRLSMTEAGHKAYVDYPSTVDGARYLAMSDTDIEALNRNNLAAVSREEDLSRKIELLRVASEHGKKLEKRVAYLKSLEDLRVARQEKERSLKALSSAGRTIQVAGDRISELVGRPVPIQAWEIPSN